MDGLAKQLNDMARDLDYVDVSDPHRAADVVGECADALRIMAAEVAIGEVPEVDAVQVSQQGAVTIAALCRVAGNLTKCIDDGGLAINDSEAANWRQAARALSTVQPASYWFDKADEVDLARMEVELTG